MRKIKFRLPFFHHKDGSFSHFDYWGAIDHRGNAILEHGSFSAPSQSSGCFKGWHEQFTGLLDKNGKEIYSEDIMKHHDFDSPVKVNWADAGYWTLSGWDFMRTDPTKGEVIGNIHENPELL
jgi:hypothetical protein